jgi:hypothetical protein
LSVGNFPLRPESAETYDKLAANYLAFVQLHPSGYGWLRANESTP